MNPKKWLASALAAVMCLSGTAAFAEKQDAVYADEDVQKALEWADTLDTKSYDEHVTIQLASEMMGADKNYMDGDVEDIWFQKHFNFTWDLLAIPDSNANDKVRTMINSGEVPDVLRWNEFDVNEINAYINQDVFRALPDDWRERWPNLAHTQDLVPAAAELASRHDGKTYALFRVVMYNYYPSDTVVNHYSVYLRADWAKAVGFELKDAYTPSEIMEYARLVKEKDPGNVGTNLIPLSTDTKYALNTFVLASYPQANKIYRGEDEQYHWGFSDEATLEGLKLWNQAYTEGLLSPEFYTFSETDAKNAFSMSGIAGAYIGAGSETRTIRDNVVDTLGLTADDIYQAAIVGEDGYYHDYANDNYWGATYFSADVDDAVMERYLDVMDFWCSPAGADLRCNGWNYVDWVYDENGERVPAFDYDQYNRVSAKNAWPIYDLISACGDDNGFNTDPVVKNEDSMYYANQLLKVYNAKLARLTDNSIVSKDWKSWGFNSDAQIALTAIEYRTVFANLAVTDTANLEDAWKNAAAENEYIVTAAIDELNENFGGAQ